MKRNSLPDLAKPLRTLNFDQKHGKINNGESGEKRKGRKELQKYEQYFEHKLNRIYFSKQLLLEMITHFEAIDQPLSLRVHDMQLFIFLLDSIEYLNNLALISEFDLDLEDYESDREFKLSKDVIKLNKVVNRNSNETLILTGDGVVRAWAVRRMKEEQQQPASSEERVRQQQREEMRQKMAELGLTKDKIDQLIN